MLRVELDFRLNNSSRDTYLGRDMHPADVDRFDDALGQRHGDG